MKIGFIGTGKLGMPCAEAIAKKGHDVCGYDIMKHESQYVISVDNIKSCVLIFQISLDLKVIKYLLQKILCKKLLI